MKCILAAIAICLVAVQIGRADSSSTTTLRSADGKYQLVVPSDWEANDFHLDAVQIGAIEKHRGEYAEVIVENQSDYTNSLVVYARAKRDTMAMSLDNPRLTPGEGSQINGWDAVTFEIHGQLPNTNTSVGYYLTVLKTKTHYVQVVAWTVDSAFNQDLADLQGLAAGFSEASDSGN